MKNLLESILKQLVFKKVEFLHSKRLENNRKTFESAAAASFGIMEES
jgi:hypothetical protein